ncbi:MAG: hypothetical protein ASARMPRED_008733 [Alectoria sarmentosa]|nr:MAG: hypothetical protein ASARMPRED_008733 [Alectoria sarmentosa]
MILRSQKARASGGPLRKDGSVSSNTKPLEEMADYVQDSDEEMEDYSEKSEEDEGSLYAPTEATSEVSEENPDEDEDSIEVSTIEPCNFLELLPRELRDKIYGYVLKLDTPLSDHGHKFKCMSCSNLTVTANKPTWQSQVYEARSLLRTCHQIRGEGKQVFYEVNSWSLHRARLRETPPGHSSATIHDTQRMFDRIRQTKATKHFKHVNMRITLSPLAYCDFTIPDSVALDDPVAVHLFELSQNPSVVAFHKLDETAQCGLFRAVFNGLVENRAYIFPKLRTITLEVSLHAKRLIPDASNNPLDRCGITFYVRIKLGCKKHATPTYHYNASLPILAPGSVTPDSCGLQCAKYEAHNQSLHPSTFNDPWSAPLLDPRRRMLSPLKQLIGVQSVEVERRWTVRYHVPGIENGVVFIHAQPLRQLWRFCTVSEMLERAGPGFDGFLDPALEYLNISRHNVVEIIEDTAEDSEHLLIR